MTKNRNLGAKNEENISEVNNPTKICINYYKKIIDTAEKISFFFWALQECGWLDIVMSSLFLFKCIRRQCLQMPMYCYFYSGFSFARDDFM